MRSDIRRIVSQDLIMAYTIRPHIGPKMARRRRHGEDRENEPYLSAGISAVSCGMTSERSSSSAPTPPG